MTTNKDHFMAKIQLVAQANLPTEYGIFRMVGFEFPDTKKRTCSFSDGRIFLMADCNCVSTHPF